MSVVSTKTPKVNVTVTEKQCRFLLDTGATVSLLDQKIHDRIGAPKLTREKNPNLLPYGGGSSIKVMGQCKLTVETKQSINYKTCYVVEGNYGSLLGYPLATKLGLDKIINQASDPKTKYPKLFEVIGKYKGEPMRVSVRLQRDIEETPFHLRKNVERELNKRLEQEIIERIEGTPTSWVSPIVTPSKQNSDEIRLCVDMHNANKAITRERHILPTIDELIHDLRGSSVYSKLDLRSGYH